MLSTSHATLKKGLGDPSSLFSVRTYANTLDLSGKEGTLNT